MSKKGVVDIHGKQYKTVVLRVNEFRDICNIKDGWAIDTCIIEMTDRWACVKASIVNPDGKVVGTGHGVEFWEGSNRINKTSALENAETSAVGRALAAIGLGGEEYASADEVINAIKTQDRMENEEKKPETVASAVDQMERGAAEEVVTGNIKKLVDKIGEEKYRIWHSRMMSNWYKAEKISDLSVDQLVDFADKQTEYMGTIKE